ncbi:MAG TPA: threonine ammonia-lyase IlvA [Solirubrobacterales bacterium]|nr:threonine ammonia-lyase IlvA [Solirubrobacterales bacterium]
METNSKPRADRLAPLVEEAVERLAGVVTRTPLELNERLSALVGGEVWLKREDLQPVRSYKLRGAYNLIAQLGDATDGVVCASAGNHAQGVAYACAALEIKGRIFLPRTTPRQKRERIAAIGGPWIEIVIDGDTYDDAVAIAAASAAESGARVIPAFDDLQIIAGQGTVAVEILDQLGREPDLLVIPVGGGGLLAGVAGWLREEHPTVAIHGVEPVGAAGMQAALDAGGPVDLAHLDSFVDGAAVRRVGEITYPLVRDSGAELVSLEPGAICAEMISLYQTDGIIAEPAGALATGTLGGPISPPPGAVTVCVVSGGNNDVSRYAEILERALVWEGLKHYFLVEFPQEPGMLRRFLDEVLGPEDDITLFEYVKRSNRETGPALVGIEIADRSGLPDLLARLNRSPLRIEPIDPDGPVFRFLL